MNEKILWTISIIGILLLFLDDFQFDFSFVIAEREPFLTIISLNANA